jgi:hypothetical protein
MTPRQIQDVITSVSIPAPLHFRVGEDMNSAFLQIRDESLGSTIEGGRKWRISYWMTKSEIVQTAFKAYLAWLEHEAREAFTYKGAAIFGPHFDVEALVELHDRSAFDVRTELVPA